MTFICQKLKEILISQFMTPLINHLIISLTATLL